MDAKGAVCGWVRDGGFVVHYTFVVGSVLVMCALTLLRFFCPTDSKRETLFTSASRHDLHPTRINQAFAAVAVLVHDLALQHVSHRLLAAVGVVPEAGCHSMGFDVV